MKSLGNSDKLANVFAWLNWLISAVLILLYIVIFIFAFLKIEADLQNKVYALAILLLIILFPAIFFFLNGLMLKAKSNNFISDDKEKMDNLI